MTTSGYCSGGSLIVKTSSRLVKIVEWSEEDQCYVGRCPELFYGGCHGDEEEQVFMALFRIVEDTFESYIEDGMPLPSPTAGKDYANGMLEFV